MKDLLGRTTDEWMHDISESCLRDALHNAHAFWVNNDSPATLGLQLAKVGKMSDVHTIVSVEILDNPLHINLVQRREDNSMVTATIPMTKAEFIATQLSYTAITGLMYKLEDARVDGKGQPIVRPQMLSVAEATDIAKLAIVLSNLIRPAYIGRSDKEIHRSDSEPKLAWITRSDMYAFATRSTIDFEMERHDGMRIKNSADITYPPLHNSWTEENENLISKLATEMYFSAAVVGKK